MPVPPALFVLGGPTLMAAKTMAFEMLPAVTSASVAAILARLLWKRLPDWVKEDVSFRNNSSGHRPMLSDLRRYWTGYRLGSRRARNNSNGRYHICTRHFDILAAHGAASEAKITAAEETDPSDGGDKPALVEVTSSMPALMLTLKT
ncbi:hypothetical protein MHU86_24200 [Fragilaria crotonensis]|nr:hypothetical protein MHU86_24200 [Fragilaria crotonensis]